MDKLWWPREHLSFRIWAIHLIDRTNETASIVITLVAHLASIDASEMTKISIFYKLLKAEKSITRLIITRS